MKLKRVNPEDAAEESAARDSQQGRSDLFRTEGLVASLAWLVALPIIPLAMWRRGMNPGQTALLTSSRMRFCGISAHPALHFPAGAVISLVPSNAHAIP